MADWLTTIQGSKNLPTNLGKTATPTGDWLSSKSGGQGAYKQNQLVSSIKPSVITQPKSNIFQKTISKIFPKKQPVKELEDKKQPQIFQKLLSPGTKATLKSMGENIKAKVKSPLIKQVGESFTSGVGLAVSITGSTLKWLGKDGMGAKLAKTGQELQQNAPPIDTEPFEWKKLYDPRFYSTTVAQAAGTSAPLMIAAIPLAVVGAYAGVAVAGATGLGTIGTFILGALGASAMARPIESAFEAGGTYDEAIKKGMTPEEANKVADDTFKKNLGLTGLDALEIGLAFLPVKGRGPKVILKRLILGLTSAGLEGAEEVAQRGITQSSLGEKVDLTSSEAQEEFAIGTILGGGLPIAGNVFNTIKEKTINEFKDEYDQIKSKDKAKDDLVIADEIAKKHPKEVKAIINSVLDSLGQDNIITPDQAITIASSDELKNTEISKELVLKGVSAKEGNNKIHIIVPDGKAKVSIEIVSGSEPVRVTLPEELKPEEAKKPPLSPPPPKKAVKPSEVEVKKEVAKLDRGVVPKGLESLAKDAEGYKDVAEFVSTQIFTKSTPGTITALIDKNYQGKTFADKLTNFYNQVVKKPITKKAVKKKVSEEFKVGDVLDPQGNTNMVGKVTIREIKGNTLTFTDSKGKEYAGMQRSQVRKLIEGGSWRKESVAQQVEENSKGTKNFLVELEKRVKANEFKTYKKFSDYIDRYSGIDDGNFINAGFKGERDFYDLAKKPITKKAVEKKKKSPAKPAKKKVVKKKKPVKIVKEKGRKLTLGVTKAKPEKQFEESVGVGLVPGRIGRPDIDKGYARPTIGKTELKTIFANNPEFEANPVLTVDKDKNLTFVGKKIRLKIFPEAMQLNRENLHPGDRVFVDEESFKKAGRIQQTRVYRGGKAIASFDSTPLSEFEDRGVPKKGTYEFKLFNKTRALIKKYAQSVGEGYLPKKALGVYLQRTKNIRVNAINDLTVIAHEVTHFLDFHYKISNVLMAIKGYSRSGNPIYDRKTAKYRKAITDLYTSYYPGGKATHKLRKRTLEGFATLLQKYVEMPTKITEQYPLLVKSFLKPGGKYYEPIMNEIIKDLNEIVAEYQGLSSLEKIGSTITSGDLNVDKESFLSFFDKVRENIADKIYPTEVLAKKAKVHFTVKDPSLWLRAYNNINSIINNNIATDRGYWSLKGNTFVKLHDYNWKTLVDLTAKRKNTEDFASYLVARDQHFNHLELDELKEEVIRITKEVKEAGGAKAARNTINASTGQSLLDEAKEIIANYKELRSVLAKNAFSRADVDKAYDENKARFKEEAQFFDTLTREDLNLLNNETVGLVTPKQYDRLTSKQGYASLKRKFYDELVGDSDAFPSQVKVGKTKVSSLLRRKGSQRTIINPLYSGMVNHHEALKKGVRQVVFNKFADIGVSAAFPNLFEKLQLKSYKDEFTGAIIYPQEKDSNIIMGRLNYKRTPVLVDAGVKSTIDNILTYDNIDIFIKLYTGLSRAFTAGTTGFYPQFAATNFVRDQVTAQANTTNKYKTIFSPLAQFSKIITGRGGIDSQYYREYMVMGGERQTFTGWQKLSPEKLFKKVNKERNGLQRAINLMEKGTDILSIPSKYSEIVTRATEYIKARKAGKPQIVALEEAGRVTAPFHHIGKWGGKYGETFIRGLPFFNATLQVLDQHIRTMGTKSGRNRMAFVLMAITAGYIASMASLLNNASDEQKEQYKDLDPEQLSGFLFFPNPSGKGLIRIAISNVFSPLGSVINMVIADKVMKANYSTRNYFDAVTSMIPDQFDPTEPVKAFLGWIPQIFQAGIETAFGIKSYPKVRPLESMGQKNMPPHLRKNENTSKFAIWLGEKINQSPLKIDHLITGYFGRSIGFATGQPSAWDFKSSVLRNYWFSNGRRISGAYELKEENDQNYTAYQRGEIELNDDEVKELYRVRILTTEFNDVMGDYRAIDIEKNPEEAGKLRNEALTVLEKIELGEKPKKFNTWVRSAKKRRKDKLKEIEKKK